MKHSAARSSDTTSNTALDHVAGDSLLAEILSRIEDERERVLILAHIGLDIPLRDLERSLKMSREELAIRVDIIIARLRQDDKLATSLSDIRRVGRTEYYQALVFRLGLLDWFCSSCGKFMVRSGRGPMRKTCSDKCRSALYRAEGVDWKSQYQDLHLKDPQTDPDRSRPPQDIRAWLEKLLDLVQAIDHARRLTWQSPEIRCRDRALLLLGFMCPIPLSPSNLAALNVKDVVRTPRGLEIVVRKPKDQGKWYAVVPVRDCPELCPVTAMSAWQGHLARNGHATGPLFIRINRIEQRRGTSGQNQPRETARLTGNDIVRVISNTTRYSSLSGCKDGYLTGPGRFVELRLATPLPDYLNELVWLKREGQTSDESRLSD